jgi:hypothetical protein
MITFTARPVAALVRAVTLQPAPAARLSEVRHNPAQAVNRMVRKIDVRMSPLGQLLRHIASLSSRANMIFLPF